MDRIWRPQESYFGVACVLPKCCVYFRVTAFSMPVGAKHKVVLFFFSLFSGRACGMQGCPAQGLIPSHSSEDTVSLTARPPGNSLKGFNTLQCHISPFHSKFVKNLYFSETAADHVG